MLRKLHILSFLLLGLLPGSLLYAASCPVDSVITYDQNDNPTAKTVYQYDEAGRTTLIENIKLTDGIITSGTKTETSYYSNGKVQSTATWKWSTAKNGWVGIERQDYTYDTQGNTTSLYIFSWDNTTNNWTNKNKYEYQYENKKQVLYITYIGNGNQWIPKTKYEQKYDAKGQTILDRYYSNYDATNDKWIGDHWYINSYNGSQLILNEKYGWKDGNWYGTSKTEYGYNTAGKQTLLINYTWNTTTSAFDKSTETYYDYDQWNNTILQEQYQWQGNQRTGIAKVRYEYTAYNSDPIMTATFQWDDAQNIFIGVDSVRIAKDAADNLILDEQYTWSANDWVGIKKEEYTYDANKLVLSTITYQWDVVKNTWGYSTKVLADYDSHKNQTKDERYQWAIDPALPDGGYWKGTKYEVTTYNDKNVETDKITYQWDDTNRRWLGNSKSVYEFDTANHLILEEQYTWSLDPTSPDGGFWQGTKKEEFGYNAANQQTKAVTYEWSTAINDWIGKTKVLSDYDSNKNQTLNEQYTWTIDASPEGGYWHGTVKEEYTFNKNKQQTSSLIYAWNDTNRDWDYVSKTKSEYDTKKNLTLDERYEWQNGAWVGTLKKEYAYNAQGQQTMFAYYAWDDAKKAFVGTQKEETELDAEGRTVLHATYTWGTTDWKGKAKNEYTYTDDGLVATDIASKWSSNKWVYSTKTENTYTDNKVTSYIRYNWVNNAWVAATRWEQVDADTERSYEWWNNSWSITQEKSKTYDGQNRLVSESMQNWQQGIQTSGSKTEYTYTGDNLTQKSSYTYNDGWVETDRITNSYDTENRQTNTTTYKRVGSELQFVSKTDNEYNGKNITTTSYTWTGSAWQGVEKEEKIYSNDLDYTGTKYEWRDGGWSGVSRIGYTYYANGKEKSVVVYRWSGSSWVEDTKTEYEYSGAKNIVTAMYQWENGTWVGQSKVGNYYDEGEDLTTATWTWTNGKWAPNTKLGESHDADGNLIGQTTYSKKGDDFIYNTKTEYEYGATLKDKTTATYNWNTTANAWQGVSKSGVTYNGSKIASETTYTWISGLTWQPNQKKEYEYGVQAKDLTTAIYQWDATISDWVGVSKSGVTYASNGKIASEFSYVWGGTEWLNVSKTEYEYGDGKNNSVATYKGNGAEWVGVVKKSETYTSTGDSLGFYTYCWKDGAWADSLKQEFTYNEYGDKILFIDAQWTGSVWSNTANSTKWEVEYYDYDKGLISLDAHYTWKTNKSDWAGNGIKFVNQYDDVGKCILEEKYSWSNNKWICSTRIKQEYDEYNNIVLKEIWQYNKTNKQLEGSSKSEYLYHNDIQLMYANYLWSTKNKNWEGLSKKEILYDETYTNEIGYILYSWSSSIWDWLGLYKYINTYKDGKHVCQLIYQYNKSLMDWQLSSKVENEYDNQNRIIRYEEFEYKDNSWQTTSLEQKIYDVNFSSKIRVEINGIWFNGQTQTYEDKTYYYHCDPKFTITVQTAKEGEGDVTGSGTYTYYARPQIAAIDAPDCYTFNQWTDGNTNATRRIVVTEDATYTAEFTPVIRTITASVKDNIGGSVVVTKPD